MRCPKCHYLSFDPEPRCRNCGYDLEVPEPDLVLHGSPKPASRRGDSRTVAVADLKFRDTPSAPAGANRLTVVRDDDPAPGDDVPEIQLRDTAADAGASDHPDLMLELPDEHVEVPEPGAARAVELVSSPAPAPPPASPPASSTSADQPAAPAAPRRAPHTTTEMPLFVKRMADHELSRDVSDGDLLIRQFPVVPPSRPPLGVRRQAEVPKPSAPPADRRVGPLDRDLLDDLRRVERDEAAQARADARAIGEGLIAMQGAADPARRLAAVAIDAAILGGIAAFVFWASLRVINVGLVDLPLASLVPLVGFLAIMDVGYLLLFTAAGGQTVGKMAMGIRVIADEGGAYVSIGQAARRAVLAIGGLGLGWLPALSSSGATLHDRVARTRVVRA